MTGLDSFRRSLSRIVITRTVWLRSANYSSKVVKRPVCVYIYIYIYMYVCMYVCMYAYVCMYVCMYVYTGWPQKSKPLPNDQKIVFNRIKACH